MQCGCSVESSHNNWKAGEPLLYVSFFEKYSSLKRANKPETHSGCWQAIRMNHLFIMDILSDCYSFLSPRFWPCSPESYILPKRETQIYYLGLQTKMWNIIFKILQNPVPYYFWLYKARNWNKINWTLLRLFSNYLGLYCRHVPPLPFTKSTN